MCEEFKSGLPIDGVPHLRRTDDAGPDRDNARDLQMDRERQLDEARDFSLEPVYELVEQLGSLGDAGRRAAWEKQLRILKLKGTVKQRRHVIEALEYAMRKRNKSGLGPKDTLPAELLAKWVVKLKDCWRYGEYSRCESGHVQGERGARCCRVRSCPADMKIRARQNAKLVERCLAVMSHPMHLTLTIQHVMKDDLKELMAKLNACFLKLRRCKLWTTPGPGKDQNPFGLPAGLGVKGGLSSFENTWSRANGHHPHLHNLIDCEVLAGGRAGPDGAWVPSELAALAWAEVEKVWGRLTKKYHRHSPQIKLTPIRNVGEIAKYVTKPGDMIYEKDLETREYKVDESGERVLLPLPIRAKVLLELAEALHGRRAIKRFGNCLNLPEEEKGEEEPIKCIVPGCESELHDYVIRWDDFEAMCRSQYRALVERCDRVPRDWKPPKRE